MINANWNNWKKISHHWKMKKGLSTLVANVIMVVVALSIAGIVANWSSLFAQERAGGVVGQTETIIGCSNADLFVSNATIDCQHSCAGVDKTIFFSVRNTGDIALDVDRFYITNKNGVLFEIRTPEKKHVTSGSTFSVFASSDFNCSDIVNNIDKFEVLSLNCPREGRDTLSSRDVAFINC